MEERLTRMGRLGFEDEWKLPVKLGECCEPYLRALDPYRPPYPRTIELATADAGNTSRDEEREAREEQMHEFIACFERYSDHYRSQHGGCFGCHHLIRWAADVAPLFGIKFDALIKEHWQLKHPGEKRPKPARLAHYGDPAEQCDAHKLIDASDNFTRIDSES